MSENEDYSVEKANIDLILAEIEKTKSEKDKLDAERKEIENRLNLKWYRKPFVWQAITAGIIAIPLIWFFITEVAIPLHDSTNVKQNLDFLKNKSAFEKVKDNAEGELKNLRDKQQQLEEQIIQQITGMHEALYDESSTVFDKLMKQGKLTEKEKKAYDLDFVPIKLVSTSLLSRRLQNGVQSYISSTL